MSPRLQAMYGFARSSPAARRRATLHLWLCNLGIGLILGTNYLIHVPKDQSIKGWIFAVGALVTSVAFLTVAPGVLLLVGSQLVKRPRLLGAGQAAVWTVFHVLLYTDTRVFNLFRYHINGQVLNLVYTRGSDEAVHLGWPVMVTAGTGLFLMGIVEAVLWRWTLARAVRIEECSDAAPRVRPVVVWAALLLPALFVEKTVYAHADMTRDQQVKALSRLFPLYPALPVDNFASKVLGIDIEERPRVVLEGVTLDYPHALPDVDSEGPRPSFLIIVIDCWRSDMFGPTVTPEIHDFWRRGGCRRFDDHASGGNSTRYGIFSMLYGLHGSYWFPILEENASPVMIDVMLDLGYDVGVFSSATQNYPELRETAWSRVQEHVFDDFPGEKPWMRDVQAGAALEAWLREPEREEDPFFGFILLDSPHQTYSHPPAATPFVPSADTFDYIALSANDGPDEEVLRQVVNRYQNAVHHSDAVVGRVLAALEDSGLLERTVVMITADHGEEFLENNVFFGHTSAFTPEQVLVPLILRGPGVEPGVERGPTSHLDLPATILELLGADPRQRGDWTLGENLFEPQPDRRRVISGWNELGMWTPDVIIRLPLSSYPFDVEVYHYSWELIADDRAILAEEAEALNTLAAECNRFLR
ncbi:MAG: sulfatase-like hydrolase/transferase [Planctomycetota bacterium]|nr:sulfatase-like hydrolase/transferase [Planctomycetota bacterium]